VAVLRLAARANEKHDQLAGYCQRSLMAVIFLHQREREIDPDVMPAEV
jgi:hypothetical protein